MICWLRLLAVRYRKRLGLSDSSISTVCPHHHFWLSGVLLNCAAGGPLDSTSSWGLTHQMTPYLAPQVRGRMIVLPSSNRVSGPERPNQTRILRPCLDTCISVPTSASMLLLLKYNSSAGPSLTALPRLFGLNPQSSTAPSNGFASKFHTSDGPDTCAASVVGFFALSPSISLVVAKLLLQYNGLAGHIDQPNSECLL